MTDESIRSCYRKYVHTCRRCGVEPLSFDEWKAIWERSCQ
jgi:hypothetical protein